MNVTYVKALAYTAVFWSISTQGDAKEWTMRHTLEPSASLNPVKNYGRQEPVAIDGLQMAVAAHDGLYFYDWRIGIQDSYLPTTNLRYVTQLGLFDSTAVVREGEPGEGRLRAIDTSNGEELWSLEVNSDFRIFEFGQDAAQLVVNTGDFPPFRAENRLIDLRTAEETLHIPGTGLNVDVDADDGMLIRGVSESFEGQNYNGFDIVELATGSSTTSVDLGDVSIFNVAISQGNAVVAVNAREPDVSELLSFDARTGDQLAQVVLPNYTFVQQLKVAGDFAIASTYTELSNGVQRRFRNAAFIFDIDTGETLFEFPPHVSAFENSSVAITNEAAVFIPGRCPARPCSQLDGQVPYYVAHFTDSVPGDFDNDSLVTASDIDLLSSVVREGGSNFFDLNDDGQVSEQDRDTWIHDIANTLSGDADLDGDVDFGDFLFLSNSFDHPGGWTDGDFDGNGSVEFGDFLLLSENFGQSAISATSVPEPYGISWMLIAAACFLDRRRSRSC